MSIIFDKGERSSSTDVHRCWSRVFQDTSSESFQKSLEQSTGTKEIIVFKGSLAVRVPRPCGTLRCHRVQTAGKNHNYSHLLWKISHRYLSSSLSSPQARMGLIFVIIYLSHAVCQWSLYRCHIYCVQSSKWREKRPDRSSEAPKARRNILARQWATTHCMRRVLSTPPEVQLGIELLRKSIIFNTTRGATMDWTS